MKTVLLALVLLALFLSAPTATTAQIGYVPLWQPIEWSATDNNYEGNPFDVIANVTFTHIESGEVRSTEMYYTGANTWSFRFAATRLGEWAYETSSEESELDGLNGRVFAAPPSDPNTTGYLTYSSNQYMIQTGEQGEMSPYNFSVFNSSRYELAEFRGRPHRFTNILNEAEENGFDVVAIDIKHNWFKLGATGYDDHRNIEPDLETFALIDYLLNMARNRNIRVHFWVWDGENQLETPVGLDGGVNGETDRRLQRYIAARLGPNPGWSMSYAADASQWVTASQINDWAAYILEQSLWPHVLMADGSNTSILNR
jgi:hypothetical protein